MSYKQKGQTKRKYIKRWKYSAQTVALVTVSLGLVASSYQNHVLTGQNTNLVVQAQEQQNKEISIAKSLKTYTKEVSVKQQDIDTWVGTYVDRYFDNPVQQSEMRMIMQCLLHRESKHGYDKGHGDSGNAGGILQFWDSTWNRMRSQMLEAGEITEIGSRYDHEQAIHTTVWAIKNNRGLEWGPLKRSSEGSNYATCPVPTFYQGVK